MKINYNATAMMANNTLNRTDNKLTAAMERLSSGLKVNHAKDNPAGLAIASRMDSQVRGIKVGTNNTNDGISVVETADGALSEISAIIQRMSELCVQASNDPKTDGDREIIDKEIQQLKQEIERIARDTEYNGMPLLDGSFDLKGYTNNPDVKVGYYSDEVPQGDYKIDLAGLITITNNADGTKEGTVNQALLETNLTGFPTAGLLAKINEDLDELTITADGDFEMNIRADFTAVTGGEVEIDITQIGAMKIQIGANEGQELGIRIPKISLEDMGIDELTSIRTYKEDGSMDIDGPQEGIESTKKALTYINSVRSRLGAYQNRLEHNASSNDITEENMTSSYSRIMDVDMAEEMTEYTTQQVLSQAGISMLAQANERPSQILQLLQ
ncbi:MAG: flagellin FliC3 [Lachnospiraceae bacterium]|nr:flagellin FliC3 [Lachnospiraceae bacterium]